MFAKNSLAQRFVLVFGLGTALTLVALGAGLAIMLKHQIERRDMTELDGKTEVVQHLLSEIRSAGEINEQVGRIRDVAIGHHYLQLGVIYKNQWLLRPKNHLLVAHVEERGINRLSGPESRDEFSMERQTWWLRRLRYQVPETTGQPLFVLVGVDVSEAKALSARFNTALALVGLAGAILMGALAWWGTRKALEPLDTIAAEAERVTVQGLGNALSISDAPIEVHGLVLSINHMLGRLGESFDALERFSSNIAHELRTPLNAMKLQSEVTLSKERSPEEYQEALHLTLVEINRLERMVGSMLFIARADRGMQTAALEHVRLEEDLRDTIDYFAIAASEREQTITLTGSLHAMCDRSMIRRAVTNLLSNAVRYAPDEARIQIELLAVDHDAIVRVSNPSQQYTEKDIQRFFDHFVRYIDDTRPANDGLGLGLPMVRSIMQMHAGTVTAKAVSGGIMFELRWPKSSRTSQVNPDVDTSQ